MDFIKKIKDATLKGLSFPRWSVGTINRWSVGTINVIARGFIPKQSQETRLLPPLSACGGFGSLARNDGQGRDCFADPRRLARVPRAMTDKDGIASSVRPELVEGRTARNDKSVCIKQGLKDEKGFVLVLAIVVMAAMTAIGLAVVTTATTDILIARNEQESKRAFYHAQAGIEEAMGRMGLKEADARFLGETTAQRRNRLADNPPAALQPNFFNAPFAGEFLGSYEVGIEYAREGLDEPWKNPDADATDIILYCADFGFAAPPAPQCNGNKATPIYKVTSTGAASGTGIDSIIVANIAATVFNVVPPVGEVYSNSAINLQGSTDAPGTKVCGETVTNCVAPNCTNECPAYQGDVDMNTWLGVDMADMAGYADAPSPYTQSGAGSVVYSPSGDEWGQICSTLSNLDGDLTSYEETPTEGLYDDVYGPPGGPSHICGNEAKLIFIDNAGAGDAKLAAGSSGRGILVVSGNLDVTGDLNWEGMIYVMGELKGNGNITLFGTIMANGTTTFGGNITAFGNVDIAMSVGDGIGGSKVVRWYRR